MWRILCRALSVAVWHFAAIWGFCLAIARLDRLSELREVIELDVVLGGTCAVGFLLWRAGGQPGTKSGWVTAAGAVLIWALVGGVFICAHQEQVRIRSGSPGWRW